MRDLLAQPEPLIRRVYAYVAYRVGDGPDAEDITSEVFERALRYRESFDARRGEPVAWLIGIARRCLADRASSGELPASEPFAEAADSHEDGAIRNLELRDAVSQLGDRDREIIALRYGADLTVREIAAALELRTNTVEVALHRALGRLRGELSGDQESAPARRGGVTRPAGDATAS